MRSRLPLLPITSPVPPLLKYRGANIRLAKYRAGNIYAPPSFATMPSAASAAPAAAAFAVIPPEYNCRNPARRPNRVVFQFFMTRPYVRSVVTAERFPAASTVAVIRVFVFATALLIVIVVVVLPARTPLSAAD